MQNGPACNPLHILPQACNVPLEKIKGFRAPFLLHDDAQRRILRESGFLYDRQVIHEQQPRRAALGVSDLPGKWRRRAVVAPFDSAALLTAASVCVLWHKASRLACQLRVAVCHVAALCQSSLAVAWPPLPATGRSGPSPWITVSPL